MSRFTATATYWITADSMEQAQQIWDDSGPEVETSAAIEEVGSTLTASPCDEATYCEHCGEDFKPTDDRAEGVDPDDPYDSSIQPKTVIVHAEPCFAEGGYTIA